MGTRKIGIIFHGIGTPERSLDPGEAHYWIDTDRFDSLLDAVTETPDRYALSFDDSNRSDVDIALPRLLARGLTADFFVLTGRLKETGSLDADDLRTLQEAGMGIGSHGVAHRDWRRLDDADLNQELQESKDRLEQICGHTIARAGIPFGSYDARVLRALRQVGYTQACSSDGGWMDPNAFLCPRRSVRNDMNAHDMANLLAGYQNPIVQARRALGMTLRRIL